MAQTNDEVMVSQADETLTRPQSLRLLADWLETLESRDKEMADEFRIHVSAWVYTPSAIQRMARLFAPCNKRFGNSWMELSRWFGQMRAEVNCSRDLVCARKVVGQESVIIPEKPYEPARVEQREIVEWECGPILSESAETPNVSD